MGSVTSSPSSSLGSIVTPLPSPEGYEAICIFVNDTVDAEVPAALTAGGFALQHRLHRADNHVGECLTVLPRRSAAPCPSGATT